MQIPCWKVFHLHENLANPQKENCILKDDNNFWRNFYSGSFINDVSQRLRFRTPPPLSPFNFYVLIKIFVFHKTVIQPQPLPLLNQLHTRRYKMSEWEDFYHHNLISVLIHFSNYEGKREEKKSFFFLFPFHTKIWRNMLNLLIQLHPHSGFYLKSHKNEFP